MRVAIVGTRGIPNHYGGFEQCAEYLALGLIKRGFEVIVYNSHNHPYQLSSWNGVQIVHCYDPENKIGTAGQFIYDLNCILDVRKRSCDIVLQLGYTSSSIWNKLLPKGSIITTNMDGLEWKRTKFSKKVKSFLKFAEKTAVRSSNYLIADSIGIQDYLFENYNVKSTYIAYGATLFNNNNEAAITPYNLVPYNYDMLVARLEPENSVEIILDGVVQANSSREFLVIGKHDTHFGRYLKKKYESNQVIRFIGGVYDIEILNNLRFYSNIYFHGHTVGGTNPSLLEAMASSALICAHDNPFNKYILEHHGIYFKDSQDIIRVIKNTDKFLYEYQMMIDANRRKITEVYDWDIIVDQYAKHFTSISELKSSLTKDQ